MLLKHGVQILRDTLAPYIAIGRSLDQKIGVLYDGFD